MADMQNTLKEVDIQVVYRRLEARKRNVSRDGQMSKRQLATAYRGYHGLESQYHALQQMSSDTMINTKHKNDHLQMRHVEDMKHLIEMEKSAKGKTDKELKAMRDDFTAQLAYQYVYKSQSFKRFYKSQQQKKPRPVSDKPEFYDPERRNSAKLAGPRPLGSLRQMDVYKDELKLKFPPIVKNDNTDEFNSPRVNMMGEKSYRDMNSDIKDDKQQHQDLTSFPNIEDAMGIEVKFRYKPKDDDRISAVTAPPAGLEAECEDLPADVQSNLITFDMGQNLMLMRQKEKEKYADKRRLLPPTPNTNQDKHTEVRKESWRRVLPETPNRPSTVFPGTRNTIEMKKTLKKEASDIMKTWDNMSIHKEMAEIAKEHHKTKLAENPVPFFERSRPTSAIMRDYREFKRYKEEEMSKREQTENDQTIIVRQMSPQPRAGSPVAQSRNRYMHAGRPGPSREGSPIQAGPLRRTESDKFPSVSRTSSYREIPDNDSLLLENALLTAAERIEIEKERRSKKSNGDIGNRLGVNTRMKRRLPTTPAMQTRQVDRQTGADVKQCKPEVKMFNTSILAIDRDTDTINRVKLANMDDSKTELPVLKQPSNKNNEHNPYTPIVNQQASRSLKGGPSPFPTDSITRIKTASALYGKDLWPKLSRQMKFDYENYTRTPPEAKKRLEARARNRKKIQQKNAQLADEMKKGKAKVIGTREEPERPPTRVSFNENVIVFQTI